VTAIEMDYLWTYSFRAPADCLQYFTGLNGAFKSFNYQTTTPQVLQSQNYNICLRQEEGKPSKFHLLDITW